MGKFIEPEQQKTEAKADARQSAEIKKLDKQEAQRVSALKRKRRGRASLISGSETGVKSETLG